jgi:hypothetical protein
LLRDEEHVVPRRADLRPLGRSNGQATVVDAELEYVDALVLVKGVSHRGKPYPGDLSNVRSRDLERECIAICGFLGRRDDLRARALEQIGRMENLRVAVTVPGIVRLAAADGELAAACAEHRGVRQQHGRPVIAAIDILGGKFAPFFRHRIPQFGHVHRTSWR